MKGELFVISDEYEKKLHPEARKVFHNWNDDVQRQVQIAELNDDDLKYLSYDDRIKLKRILEVPSCLNKCVDINDGDKLYDVYFGDIFFSKGVISQLRRDLLNIEFDVVPPLKKIYEGRVAKAKEEGRKRVEEEKLKAAKAEEEQRKREEEERQQAEKAKEEERKREENRKWDEAVSHVFPYKLLKEAKRYLNKDDIDKLYDAAGVAINVYLKQGDNYLDSYKTSDYRWYLRKINYEKEKEQIRLDAGAQAQAFCPRLDQGLKEIERKLSPKKEAPAVRFKRYCSKKGENRYLGESFTDILASDDDEKRKWKQGYIPAAEEELLKFIPEELRDFILTKPTMAFFLLPSANYSHCGVPCLDFYFDVFAVVTITVSAQAGQKVFNGYKFNFLTNLREPKLLGFYQITITPDEPHFWQSVPIGIIHALVGGNLQPQRTTILERTEKLTVYEVKKFDMDTCEIPISFERYCRSLGSVKKMEELGIIKKRTAEILELPQPIINQKESKSKKAQAFALFRKGKRPGDFEVKTLGIKPESAYRYFQDWKKEATVGNNRIQLWQHYGSES